jgi:hypothetical protein
VWDGRFNAVIGLFCEGPPPVSDFCERIVDLSLLNALDEPKTEFEFLILKIGWPDMLFIGMPASAKY